MKKKRWVMDISIGEESVLSKTKKKNPSILRSFIKNTLEIGLYTFGVMVVVLFVNAIIFTPLVSRFLPALDWLLSLIFHTPYLYMLVYLVFAMARYYTWKEEDDYWRKLWGVLYINLADSGLLGYRFFYWLKKGLNWL